MSMLRLRVKKTIFKNMFLYIERKIESWDPKKNFTFFGEIRTERRSLSQ